MSGMRMPRMRSWSFSARVAATVRALLAPAVLVAASSAGEHAEDDDDEHGSRDDYFHQGEAFLGCHRVARAGTDHVPLVVGGIRRGLERPGRFVDQPTRLSLGRREA